MTRKEYLLKLINNRDDHLGDIKGEIINNIDTFTDEKIEQLINVFEKSAQRRKKIQEGDGDIVIEEIQKDKINKHDNQLKQKIKQLHEKEDKQKKQENIELNALLSDLEQIK